MAREAKIGLLLGLMFIVGIAVVLRGLHQTDELRWEEQLAINGDMTHSTETPAESMDVSEGVDRLAQRPENLGPSWAVGTGEPQAERPVPAMGPGPYGPTIGPVPGGYQAGDGSPSELGGLIAPWSRPGPDDVVDVAQASQREQDRIRYASDLPGNGAADAEPLVITTETGALERALDELVNNGNATPVAVVGSAVDAPSQPMQTHVVADGENLWKIAVKAYGAKEGKRYANMQRIYEANKDVLSSADEVYAGQKLKIPSLPGQGASSGSKAPSAKRTASPQPAVAGPGTPSTSKGRAYVVQKDDTLWSIAAKELGSGIRYKEIHRLNGATLKNADRVVEGMKIMLPGQ